MPSHTKPPVYRRVELIIVFAVIAGLAAYSIPLFLRSRTGAKEEECRQNIVKIEFAMDEYQLAYEDAIPFSMDALYGGGKVREPEAMPVCPLNGKYSIRAGKVFCDHETKSK